MSRYVFVSIEVAVADDFEGDASKVAEIMFDHACTIENAAVESVDGYDYNEKVT